MSVDHSLRQPLPAPVDGDLWRPRPMPVVWTRQDTADTVSFGLDPGDTPFRYLPGQFNMLYLFGHGEVPISISGDAEAPGPIVHTVRGVGAVTRPMVKLQVGDVVGVRGPFGTAWPLDQARGTDVIIVAGGIGLAPLRPAILHLLRHREDFARVIVLYGARAPSEMLYTDELRTWRGRFDTTVEVTVDRAEPGWLGSVGLVTRLLERMPFDADDATVFTCGPEVMMRFVVREALRRGVPADRVWLTMERNMKCAVGLCGHCQWGDAFMCRDGAVFRYDRISAALNVAEL